MRFNSVFKGLNTNFMVCVASFSD